MLLETAICLDWLWESCYNKLTYSSRVSYGAPRSAWRTVGENPTQTKSSQQFGTDHYVA
ncbi:hypothetical protein [Wolbachia endosymbiont (group A) of Nomada goodeniana]|uniref:hypothetical protein n=1 Tax=Wolbachia endosymbiont (group A) of Nomada goodeniana TaxID=3066207 RepID=UPI00334181B4